MKIEDQGRPFEIGFNLGILNYLQHKKLAPQWVDYYRQELENVKLNEINKKLIENASSISCSDRQIIETWSQLLLLKGFLGGYNFLSEYLQGTEWRDFENHVEVLYYQCAFAGDNSLKTHQKSQEQLSEGWLSQLEGLDPTQLKTYINQYKGTGEFLRADTLLLLRYTRSSRQEYRILVVDESVFAIQSEKDLTNVQDFIGLIKSKLIKEINYLRSKSVFSKLRIDTGENPDLDFLFSPGLKDYFTAFKSKDKESAKLIQAAGYAYSFYQFAEKTGIIPKKAKVILSAIGYSDRGMNTMTIHPENLSLFETCYQIYKHESSGKEMISVQKQVFNQIKRQMGSSFDRGKEFVEKLINIPPDRTTVVTHHEQIQGFLTSVAPLPDNIAHQYDLDSSLDLRNGHAELIRRSLLSDSLYLFLTGNPGIGKTTAIANFLQQHQNEGFLFFYVSPRKQVNLDILEKFKDNDGKWCSENLVCLNTNSQMIAQQGGDYTVQYLSPQWQGNFKQQSVLFLDGSQDQKQQRKYNSRLQRKTEDLIVAAPQNTAGVIRSMCEAIHTLVDRQSTNKIVASISIQALKKTPNGSDTLKHFGQIFKGAYNSRTQAVLPAKMQAISKRFKHLFIMIDEITGDDSGVEFLNRMTQILRDYGLTTGQHGFNPKFIIADASIVDKDVIQQHLKSGNPEPDKIFFRKAQKAASPLTVELFRFKRYPATLINTNSYPASDLNISYNIIIHSTRFQERDRLKPQEDDLAQKLREQILADIERITEEQRETDAQILVYIQNKQELQKLIEALQRRWQKFEKNQDYLEIHASLSENERQTIHSYQNEVKIIFMTSSGSRGLSFPKVKHILVDIPRFQVEKNLMEIIQVIYRGRGNLDRDNQSKSLHFYLAERAVYFDDEPQLSLQEKILSIFNILLLLKASIMTRILGAGKMGRQEYLIIPIGGKSVSAAGQTLSSQLANLLRELKREVRNRPKDRRLKQSHEYLQTLLSQADFTIPKPKNCSYIAENFKDRFLEFIQPNLSRLIDFPPLETGYLQGNLLMVPLGDRVVSETYTLFLDLILNPRTGELWKNLRYISSPKSDYPENLKFATRTAIDLIDEIRETENKSQRYEQQSQRLDRYYALPLLVLIVRERMKDYLDAKERIDDEYRTFRYILGCYVRSLYPVDNVLPMGDQYENFPFLIFSSYSLGDIRKQWFGDRYLLNSHELNILNLVLSQD
ncbi:helicase-related protein [Roseofilum capinflatum]|uniref:Helicase-related protein n=1 Tax=Roseofilum capinflatum BLCC-M114 TaxID=3022440 RepID=A0ABT7B663_9CYAN|nr:helicase-related protein [Roseofilum capinflatum]MDJ1174605.1 helicase-related protein [Roseofilum capinflatum BLCC-M114]